MKKPKLLLLSIVFLFLFSLPVEAASIKFSWDPNPPNEDVLIYRLYSQLEANDVQVENILVLDLVDQNNPYHILEITSLGKFTFWLTADNGIAESDPTAKIMIDLSKTSAPTNLKWTLTISSGLAE